jgi:arylsulfatase A-like enzyme
MPVIPDYNHNLLSCEQIRCKRVAPRFGLKNFRDMTLYADQCVGRIVDALQRKDCVRNAVVIYTTDNGTHRSLTYPIISILTILIKIREYCFLEVKHYGGGKSWTNNRHNFPLQNVANLPHPAGRF